MPASDEEDIFSHPKASESPRQRSSPGWTDAWMVGCHRKNAISTVIISSRYMIPKFRCGTAEYGNSEYEFIVLVRCYYCHYYCLTRRAKYCTCRRRWSTYLSCICTHNSPQFRGLYKRTTITCHQNSEVLTNF